MLFGKLDASRHLTVGCWAIAGDATATADVAAARRAKFRRDTVIAKLLPERRQAASSRTGCWGFLGCRRRSRRNHSKLLRPWRSVMRTMKAARALAGQKRWADRAKAAYPEAKRKPIQPDACANRSRSHPWPSPPLRPPPLARRQRIAHHHPGGAAGH